MFVLSIDGWSYEILTDLLFKTRLAILLLLFLITGQAAYSYTLKIFQVVSLIVEALTWCSMLVMLGSEIKVYICEFRWFVRFGVIYALVGDAVMLNLVLSLKEFYNRYVFCHILGFMFLDRTAWYFFIFFNLINKGEQHDTWYKKKNLLWRVLSEDL